MEELEGIVVDCGSNSIQVGFAGDDAPRCETHSIVGRPKMLLNSKSDVCFCGKEALAKREILRLRNPIHRGVVTNRDDMKELLDYTFNDKLRIMTKDRGVVYSEPVFNPKRNRETLAEITFEDFDFKACYVAFRSILSLYASGRVHGIVCNSNHGTTSMIPIYEGRAITSAANRINFGGKDVSLYLENLLLKRGINFGTSYNKNMIINDIKEKMCYVPIDYFKEKKIYEKNKKIIEKEYELLDGKRITVGLERFQAPEIIFKPEIFGSEYDSLPEMVFKSINKCPIDIKKDLLNNIIISGGNTMINGISERFISEINKLNQSTGIFYRNRIVSPPERKISSWIGGSILASLSTFQRMWVSKEEYEEYGPSIVVRKSISIKYTKKNIENCSH